MLVAPHTIILCVHNHYNQSSKQTTKKTFKLYDKSSSIKVVVWVVYIIFEVLCLKPQRKYQCPITMRGSSHNWTPLFCSSESENNCLHKVLLPNV